MMKEKRPNVQSVDEEGEKLEESSKIQAGEKRKRQDLDSDDEEVKEDDLSKQPPITIILDLASLETVKTKKGDFQLLNCDDHIGLLRKHKREPGEYRPDIIHQELMAVLDSPLNKAGKVRVLVHTEKNVLFEISNKTRIPRTFKRFSGLMVQLLHRLKIRSSDGRDMLLKVIKNPISRHIPAGAKCIGFSDKGRLMSPHALAASLPHDLPVVFVFGAQATRGIVMADHPYMEEMVAISQHPLSGVVAVNRVLGAMEHVYNIM
ncbi:hypothetical protein EON64_15220 [archaeon]|nr:MAG: hypothetical protein EON64_15220 [archaeon]